MTSVTTFSWTANLSSSRRLHTAFDIRQMDGGRFHDTFLTQILPLILLAIDITIDQPQKTMRMCFKYIPLIWEVLIKFVWQLAGRNLQPPLSNMKKKTVHFQNGSVTFVDWSMKFWEGISTLKASGSKKSAWAPWSAWYFFARNSSLFSSPAVGDVAVAPNSFILACASFPAWDHASATKSTWATKETRPYFPL